MVKVTTPKMPVETSSSYSPAKTLIKSVAPKSFSIKNGLNGKPQDKQPENIEVENNLSIDDSSSIDDVPDSIPDINEDNLKDNWLLFANRIKDSNPNHSSILRTYQPKLLSEFQIELTLETQLQVDIFMEIKSELVLFLRDKYNSKLISVTETIAEQQNQSFKPYTPEDKFKYMIQKNPSLIKLKQDLNLDFG